MKVCNFILSSYLHTFDIFLHTQLAFTVVLSRKGTHPSFQTKLQAWTPILLATSKPAHPWKVCRPPAQPVEAPLRPCSRNSPSCRQCRPWGSWPWPPRPPSTTWWWVQCRQGSWGGSKAHREWQQGRRCQGLHKVGQAGAWLGKGKHPHQQHWALQDSPLESRKWYFEIEIRSHDNTQNLKCWIDLDKQVPLVHSFSERGCSIVYFLHGRHPWESLSNCGFFLEWRNLFFTWWRGRVGGLELVSSATMEVCRKSPAIVVQNQVRFQCQDLPLQQHHLGLNRRGHNWDPCRPACSSH